MTVTLDRAVPYRLQNLATNNVIAQTPGFPRDAGLCAYGGGTLENDQLWYFLVQGGYLRIMNLSWLGTVIYSDDAKVAAYRTDDANPDSPADQHWRYDASPDFPSGIVITSIKSGRSILDPHARGQTDSLEAQPLVPRDSRFVWTPIAAN